eukprot:Awhi_evm1s14690
MLKRIVLHCSQTEKPKIIATCRAFYNTLKFDDVKYDIVKREIKHIVNQSIFFDHVPKRIPRRLENCITWAGPLIVARAIANDARCSLDKFLYFCCEKGKDKEIMTMLLQNHFNRFVPFDFLAFAKKTCCINIKCHCDNSITFASGAPFIKKAWHEMFFADPRVDSSHGKEILSHYYGLNQRELFENILHHGKMDPTA